MGQPKYLRWQSRWLKRSPDLKCGCRQRTTIRCASRNPTSPQITRGSFKKEQQKSTKIAEHMGPKSWPETSKWSPNTSKIEAQTLQNRAQTGPRGVQDDQKTEKQHRPNKKKGGIPEPYPILEENAANMAPSWPPMSIKNLLKTMQKSIKKMMPLGIDFWMDFGGFLVPKWSQVGIKMGSKMGLSEKVKKRIWS